ncbi:MAG: SpoIIE family protein phosphatase, partial [Vicinamibacteria bacterium]
RISQMLLIALGVVAAIFAFFYLIALLFGTALVRSITGSVHALSLGTSKLQRGDFSHRIIVHSKDQLGDLAQSFNSMSQGIEDLLEQQGEKERMEEDLRVARNIQMSLLPQEYVEVEGLKIAAVCLPANEMGGDYFDLLPLSNDRLGVLIADVSGKGTSAALYMAELKGLILSLSRNHDSPKALLIELNEILAPNLDRRSFITMTYAIVDSPKRTLRVSRAGHNPLIHFDGRTGLTHLLSPPGLALGFDSGRTFKAVIQEIELPLVPGDIFLFFTDGISEAMNGASDLFGESRLASILKDANTMSSDDLKEHILQEVRTFAAGESPHDDMTLVIVKVV